MLIILYLIAWLFHGFSFQLLGKAIFVDSYKIGFELVPIFATGWLIGYLSFTPAGLGVREGTILVLLSSILPNSLAALLVILHRLLWIFTELILLVISRIVSLYMK